jgi:DNA-directed RNA polymerase II subunit RPB9
MICPNGALLREATVDSPSSNMLYPEEDEQNSRLMFTCRNCSYSEPADSPLVYRNALKEQVAETAGNVDDVAEDPTVRDDACQHEGGYDSAMDVDVEGEEMVPELCTLCGNEILCPSCHQPTANYIALEADDPGALEDDPQQEADAIEAEKRERALSGAGSRNS